MCSSYFVVTQDLNINFDGFITHNMPFSDINKAIQLLEEGKSLRCVLHL
jgi:alcohol dehydrogenase